MQDDNSYITLMPAVRYGYWLVVVKKPWRDDYIDARVSHEAMKREQAEALAKSWAAAMRLEIRL